MISKTTKTVLLTVLFAAAQFVTGTAFAEGLEGSSWRITMIDNGKEAMQSVIAGTELTLYFGADGIVSGKAGVNSYRAPYKATGDKLSVGVPAATRMFSDEPKGVMEQERMFLEILPKTAGWRMTDGYMTLVGSNGSALIVMTPMSQMHEDTLIYSDGKENVVIETFSGERILMSAGGKAYPMMRVPAASGAKYAGIEDPNVIFWSKGEEAMINVDGKDRTGFMRKEKNPNMYADHVSIYRAGRLEYRVAQKNANTIHMTNNAGQEYWLTIRPAASGALYAANDGLSAIFWSKDDRATITIDGKKLPEFERISMEESEPVYAAVTPMLFKSDNGDMRATVQEAGLNHILLRTQGQKYLLVNVESASGAKYVDPENPKTMFWSKGDQAIVVIEGSEYSGQIMARKNLPVERYAKTLTDVEWKVEQFGGSALVPHTSISMFFNSNGRLSGMATVNSYSTIWTLENGRISVGNFAMTLKAGTQAQMDQETRFLKALENIDSYSFEKGKLIIKTTDGQSIVASRSGR